MKNVDRLFITTATTYTAQRDCEVIIHAFGSSGSGGMVRGSSSGRTATGGGAGARCSKRVKLKAGDTLTLSPGIGLSLIHI